MTTTDEITVTTSFLDRPGGRIAFDVRGSGPLVVCVPGMGDVRSVYRYLTPALVDAGYRVATMDLRGHGDSDTTFDRYDDVAAGGDVVALVAHLGGPAVVVGNSMGAGAAVWAAAEAPEAVAGLALLGPFVRNAPVSRIKQALFRAALVRPWGPKVWPLAYRSLNVTRAADLDAHVAQLRERLRDPARWRAFAATTRTSHAPAEARLRDVRCPVVVIMGEKDPDFPDPAAEARWIGERLSAPVVMVEQCGHYPMVEQPSTTKPAVLALLGEVFPR